MSAPATVLDGTDSLARLLRERATLRRTVLRLERERSVWRERCASARRAYERATRDPLTGLVNRALFTDRMALALKLAARDGRCCAVAYLDLDGFKEVNDGLGHAAGDELLRRLGRRLRRAMRDSDTVARFGGDEFAVLLEGLGSAEAAQFLQQRVYRILCAPLVLDATRDGAPVVVRPRASLGIALFPDHAARPEELLKLADASMYAAKRSGGGVWLCDGSCGPRPA